MPSNHASFNVALIGLGAMGSSMARRLVDCGVAVKGYDLNLAATVSLRDTSDIAHASPTQTVANASMVLLTVATAEQVSSALFAPKIGAVHGLTENATILLHSTVEPTIPQDVRHRLDSEYCRHDVVVLDAPVIGDAKNATDGTLSIMISAAKPEHLERPDVKSVLACLAQKVYHISGPIGSALKIKVLNQVLCGMHIVAAAEIVGLASVIGLDTKRLYEDVASPGVEPERKKKSWSWMFEDRVPRMLDYQLPSNSTVSTILKDVRLGNSEAERAGVQLSLCKASQFVYENAVSLGFGDADDSALLYAYLRRETDQGPDRIRVLQTVSEMGGMFPKDEAAHLIGLLRDALAAVHAMAAYEVLMFAEGLHLCRTLKQCGQWTEILSTSLAASTIFAKGMPRIFESETHGTGSLELLVPNREGLLKSLVSSEPGKLLG